MTTAKWTVISVAALLVVFTLGSSLYVVEIPNYALVFQFGRVVKTRMEPGLYFKTPFIQTVQYFDSRLREWDGDPGDLFTVDKENIEVNTFARWRVTDPRTFYEALRTESGGQSVLDEKIDSSVKNVISAQPLMEVLRNTRRRLRYRAEELEEAEASRNIQIEQGRESIVATILATARADLEKEYGLVLDGVGVKHLNYVPEVIPNIHERMRSERIRVANRYESEGKESAALILGQMAKELEQIESEGYKDSTTIRGEADAAALKTYAEAYGQDAEFYAFLRSLETMEKAIGEKTRLVIGTDGPLFRFLKELK